MSTRGVIARRNGDGFTGRYHHWDSYPSGLGKTLFKWAKLMPLDQMLKMLLDDHPAGWSTIVGTDPKLEPGYVELDNKSAPNRPRCYCHGDRSEPQDDILTEANASAVGCEYAYVFDEQRRTMAILSSYCRDGHKMIGMFGMGDPEAAWRLVATIDLDGEEPDWEELDNRARLVEV